MPRLEVPTTIEESWHPFFRKGLAENPEIRDTCLTTASVASELHSQVPAFLCCEEPDNDARADHPDIQSVDIFSAPFLGQKTALKKKSKKQPNVKPPIPRRAQRLPETEAVRTEELRLKAAASRRPLLQKRCLSLLQHDDTAAAAAAAL